RPDLRAHLRARRRRRADGVDGRASAGARDTRRSRVAARHAAATARGARNEHVVRLLAALFVGTACALLVGAGLGLLPQRRARVSRGHDRYARAQVWLQQAGVPLSPARFWLASAGVGLVALLVFTSLSGSVLVGLVPAVAVAAAPRMYFGRKRRV